MKAWANSRSSAKDWEGNIWGNTVNKYGGNKCCGKTLGVMIVSTKRRYQTTTK